MTIQQAIEKAIEGGWKPVLWIDIWKAGDTHDLGVVIIYGMEGERVPVLIDRVVLKPDFWQALGKSMGWEAGIDTYPYKNVAWIRKWHYFIDHLAEGKDIESFFEAL